MHTYTLWCLFCVQLKQEVISWNPRIILFHGFLSSDVHILIHPWHSQSRSFILDSWLLLLKLTICVSMTSFSPQLWSFWCWCSLHSFYLLVEFGTNMWTLQNSSVLSKLLCFLWVTTDVHIVLSVWNIIAIKMFTLKIMACRNVITWSM